MPLPLRVSATRGAINASGSEGVALLVGQLHSPELAMRDIALFAVRESRDLKVTTRLVSELDRLAPGMQALLITALADREDLGALPAIEARAKSGSNEEVRLAALRGVRQISSKPLAYEWERIQSSGDFLPRLSGAGRFSGGNLSHNQRSRLQKKDFP
ncbi:MAG: hypothetical protein ACREH8_12655, partial [Opitutaceae bacterium]